VKQAIVVNESLDLPRGKLASQVAHASLAAFLVAPAAAQSACLADGMAKVVLGCGTEAELLALYRQAADAGLPADVVADAGRTIVAPGTVTCLGIGPADETAIDSITGSLPLVR
jgi:PTH2 family peptidyl-tRNA hydrolase